MDPRSSPRSNLLALALVVGSLLIGVDLSCPRAAFSAEPPARIEHPVKGEAALLGRLLAPCCWAQTLDVHTGPEADSLRAEVRMRLASGESPRSVEGDLVARYGPRIVAEPPGGPLPWVGLGIGALSLAGAAGLLATLRRWARRSGGAAARHAVEPSCSGQRDAEDDRLDEELRRLDD